MLAIKKISPTRLIKNALFTRLKEAEDRGADADELRAILGPKATKRGLFEGDLENGELEIGQIASAIKEIKPVDDIMNDLISSFDETCKRMINM